MVKGKRSGFTIVELTIVLVIIAIMAAVALPKFFNMLSFTGRFFYDDVLSSVRYAQKYAVATGCNIEVKPNFGTGALILQRAQSCNSGVFNQPVFDPALNKSSYSRQAPANTSFSSSNAFPIYFDALGRAHATPGNDSGVDSGVIGTYTITVQGRTITIIGQTGYTQ